MIAANKRASAILRELSLDLHDKCCDDHPEQENTLLIETKPDGTLHVSKDFCCPKFEAQLRVEIENDVPVQAEMEVIPVSALPAWYRRMTS